MKVHIMHVPGAHPERDEIVRQYVEDPEVEVCLHLDPQRRGCIYTWLDALECATANDGTRWSTLVQDDALPMPGWKDQLPKAQWYSPAPVLGLSYFGSITETVARKGYPYVVGEHTIWGAAVTYERKFLAGLADWARWIVDETEYCHDDRMVSAYAQKVGTMTALTTRALFDQPVKASLLGHSTAGRERRPSLTIADEGPEFSSRSVVRKMGAAKEQRDWLASYGTPQQPMTYTYRLLRKGFVQRVELATEETEQ